MAGADADGIAHDEERISSLPRALRLDAWSAFSRTKAVIYFANWIRESIS